MFDQNHRYFCFKCKKRFFILQLTVPAIRNTHASLFLTTFLRILISFNKKYSQYSSVYVCAATCCLQPSSPPNIPNSGDVEMVVARRDFGMGGKWEECGMLDSKVKFLSVHSSQHHHHYHLQCLLWPFLLFVKINNTQSVLFRFNIEKYTLMLMVLRIHIIKW